MDDTPLKQEELDATEADKTTPNCWSFTRAGTKRRKLAPQTRKMSNRCINGGTLPARHYPSAEELPSSADSTNCLGYPGFAGHASPAASSRNFAGGSRGGEALGQRESATVAQLRQELERYKQENGELRAKLAEVLDLRELETTLRMTLQSFGVPTPKPPRAACSCSHSYELLWQPQPEFQQRYSSSEDEEEVAEFERAIRSRTQTAKLRAYQTVVQPQPQLQPQSQPQPQPPSQDPSTLYQSNGGRTRAVTQRDTRRQGAPASPGTQVELVPSCGIFVDSSRLSSIAYKKGWSYTLLTRSLMPMVFERCEMETSCVRGERATGKGSLNSPARPALNQAKVQAIISFVSSHFPDIQPYQITQTMNQKLVDVRGTIKKRKHSAKFANKQAAMLP